MRTTNVVPGPGNIAVKPLPDGHEIPVSGTSIKLWVPSSNTNEGLVCEVVAVSPNWHDGDQERQSNYELGDVVVLGKFSGTRLKMGRDEYTILREQDVLCKLVTTEAEDASPV